MPSTRRLAPVWIIAGILLFAANLRGPFTAVGPVLDVIQKAFGIGAGAAGALITLPLLTFCLVSPFAAGLARRLGLERALFLALVLIGGGILARSVGPIGLLYAGTAVLGAGIAIGNTLLPSLLKRDFPDQIAKLTAVYALTMGLASGVGSAVVVPLTQAFDWQVSLGAFIVLPLAGALLWLPQLRRRTDPAAETAEAGEGRAIWRSPLAWQITAFFGVNSFLYYAMVSSLPSVLVAAGFAPEAAGGLHGVMQLATAFPGLVLAPLVRRMKDQRGLAAGLALMALTAILGLFLAPRLAMIWAALFGFANGGVFILALAFVGLRTTTAPQTARLSGMTQSLGYMLSAMGPLVAGALHDWTGAWSATLITCCLLCLVLAGLGLSAGRNAQLAD